MALELPGWLVTAFYVIGLPWPGIDEDELRAWATSVRGFADDVTENSARTSGTAAALDAASQSEFTAALAGRWQRRNQLVADLRGPMNDFADALDGAADVVVAQKYACIAAIAAFATEFAVTQAGAFLSFGLDEVAVPAELLSTRELVKLALEYLEAELIGKLINVAAQEITDHVNAFLGNFLNDSMSVAFEFQSLKISYDSLREAGASMRGQATQTEETGNAAYSENAGRELEGSSEGGDGDGDGGQWAAVMRAVEQALLDIAGDLFKSLPAVICRAQEDDAAAIENAATAFGRTDTELADEAPHPETAGAIQVSGNPGVPVPDDIGAVPAASDPVEMSGGDLVAPDPDDAGAVPAASGGSGAGTGDPGVTGGPPGEDDPGGDDGDGIGDSRGERSFSSPREAAEFMETEIDRPVPERVTQLGEGIELRTAVLSVDEHGFSNVYDIALEPGAGTARIHISDRPIEPPATEQADGALVTTSGGFFFLADKASGLPRQAGLNLAIDDGRITSLPVVDREAVMTRDGVLSADHIRAEGDFAINGSTVTWAGSRTDRDADCYVYGNGNAVITHVKDPATGTSRVLDETSRLTPAIPEEDRGRVIDVGFMATGDGGFRSVATSESGRLDIFSHDLVARCPAEYIDQGKENRLDVLRIGSLRGDDLPESAVSVGPSLDTEDFPAHPINHDASLGSQPPFTERRMARLVLYEDLDNKTHLRLFDGRPGSADFRGVTPTEARESIAADTGYRWGCFLDPGQTAKMWVNERGIATSYGNRHYLRWPQNDDDNFVWVPDKGRPIPSFITIRQ